MFRTTQGQSDEPLDERVAQLFAAYREAIPDPEPSPGFQPEMWRKIEARQTYTFSIKRLAQGIATAAAAVSLAMGLFLWQNTTSIYSTSYVDLLAADQSHDVVDADVLPVDTSAGERAR